MAIRGFASMTRTGKNTKAPKHRRAQAEKQTQMAQEKNQVEVIRNDVRITVDEKTIERNKYVFELVNMWIANADNKINIAFAMLSAVVAVVTFVAENMLSKMAISQNARSSLLYAFYTVFIIAAACFCLSIFFYVASVIPRLTSGKTIKCKRKQKEKKKPKYSIFYDEIKDFEKAEDYVEAAKRANEDVFNEEILKEIYYNSGICSKKMNCFKWGGIASFVTIVLVMIASLLYFLYAIGV